jgi:hypothetical protein
MSQYATQQKSFLSQVEVASNRRTGQHKGSVVLMSGETPPGAGQNGASSGTDIDPSKATADYPHLKQLADQKTATAADAKADPKSKDREALPQRLIDYFICFG